MSDGHTCEGTVWVRVIGDWGKWGGDGNAASLYHRANGALFGTDRAFFGGRIGLVLGMIHGDSSIHQNRGSHAGSDNYQIGAYLSHDWGQLGAHAGLAYIYHSAVSERDIALTGKTAHANY